MTRTQGEETATQKKENENSNTEGRKQQQNNDSHGQAAKSSSQQTMWALKSWLKTQGLTASELVWGQRPQSWWCQFHHPGRQERHCIPLCSTASWHPCPCSRQFSGMIVVVVVVVVILITTIIMIMMMMVIFKRFATHDKVGTCRTSLSCNTPSMKGLVCCSYEL